jgi:hypothetical protein
MLSKLPPTPLALNFCYTAPYTKTKQQNLRFSLDLDMNDYQHGSISVFFDTMTVLSSISVYFV